MALDLNEYIKMSYERPNRKVLEGLGASEGLIEYLMETPENTNWNMLGSLDSDSGSGAEVWFTGTTVEAQGGYYAELSPTEHATDVADLISNPSNYDVKMNGVSLPEVDEDHREVAMSIAWADSLSDPTTYVMYSKSDELVESWEAIFISGGSAGVSVEVSVEAK